MLPFIILNELGNSCGGNLENPWNDDKFSFLFSFGNFILILTSLLLLTEIRDQWAQWTHQMTKMPKATHWGLSISMGRASSSSSSGRTGTSDITVVRRLIWSSKPRDYNGFEVSCWSDQGIFRRPLKLIGTIHRVIRALQKRFRHKKVI